VDTAKGLGLPTLGDEANPFTNLYKLVANVVIQGACSNRAEDEYSPPSTSVSTTHYVPRCVVAAVASDEIA
jgi:hypothetical protein